jgi:hypothetical protein
MRITFRFINGLVFGLSHQYYYDLDAVEGDKTFGDKIQEAPRVPMVFLYLGPFQFIVTW